MGERTHGEWYVIKNTTTLNKAGGHSKVTLGYTCINLWRLPLVVHPEKSTKVQRYKLDSVSKFSLQCASRMAQVPGGRINEALLFFPSPDSSPSRDDAFMATEDHEDILLGVVTRSPHFTPSWIWGEDLACVVLLLRD